MVNHRDFIKLEERRRKERGTSQARRAHEVPIVENWEEEKYEV